jgi:hypothetical protein
MKDFQATFVNTDGNPFPLTASVNSSGGGATDGTEFVKAMVDDFWGWMQDLLYYTDDTPNGNSEIGASQLLNSIIKIVSNITSISSNVTHTVEDWNKRSMLLLTVGCTSVRVEGGVGCNRSNRLFVHNYTGVDCDVDFGAVAATEVITLKNDQNVEFFYDDSNVKFKLKTSIADQVIIEKDVSWDIGDADVADLYVITLGGTGKMVVAKLPTLANNIGKNFNFKISGNGIFQLDADVSTIDGKADQYCFSDGDFISVKACSSEYKILSHNMNLRLGGVNSNDGSARYFGNAVITFDNLVGTFEIGEIVREYSDVGHTTATGRYGTIVTKTATTLTLIFSDGKATFTNNYYLLGMNSGATADVNGNSKNYDSGVVHNTGFDLEVLTFTLWVLNATTFAPEDASSVNDYFTDGGTGYGVWSYGDDNSKFTVRSAAGGVYVWTGVNTLWTNQDYSYDIYISRKV